MGNFSQNLKFLRKSRDLSQESLATAIGLNRGNIASYEKGSAEPNLNNLLKIARFFKTDVADLIETNMEKNSNVLNIISGELNQGKGSFSNGIALTEQLQEKLMVNNTMIENFKTRSDEMVKILEGFRQFHKYKMESQGEVTDDVKKMALDYERLLDILDEVLKSNKNLIHLIEHQ